MKQLLAIDPGNVYSAWILYDMDTNSIIACAKEENHSVLHKIRNFELTADHLAIEMVASYGMAVGETVFETCVWIGRFIEAWLLTGHSAFTKVYRREVKMYICGSMRAKDANIRQALLDRFGAPGTKKNPGPTYGITADIWQALALAVTYVEAPRETPKEPKKKCTTKNKKTTKLETSVIS